jgi:hypothetical protein
MKWQYYANFTAIIPMKTNEFRARTFLSWNVRAERWIRSSHSPVNQMRFRD